MEAGYKDALALLDSGSLSEAKDGFVKLGGYKDSKEMAQECQNRIDYNDADALMKSGDYVGAKKIYEKLGGYKESDSLAAECQNTLDYNAAAALMDAGKNEEALNAFLKLGKYSDSADMAAECQSRLDYAAARAFMDSGDVKAALEMFDKLGSYQDSKKLAAECQNRLDYASAEDALNNGDYYSAYVIFKSLYGYSDSAERAESCIQPSPENGEMYRNPNYSAKKRPLTIKTPDDGLSTYMKVYSDDGTLVSTLFILSGKKVKIKLPSGTYKFNVAYGTKWFGPDDMFGDDGSYYSVRFENYLDTWTLEPGYIYTLELRVSSGGFGGMPENREDF